MNKNEFVTIGEKTNTPSPDKAFFSEHARIKRRRSLSILYVVLDTILEPKIIVSMFLISKSFIRVILKI